MYFTENLVTFEVLCSRRAAAPSSVPPPGDGGVYEIFGAAPSDFSSQNRYSFPKMKMGVISVTGTGTGISAHSPQIPSLRIQ